MVDHDGLNNICLVTVCIKHSDYDLEVTVTNMSVIWPGWYEQYVSGNPLSKT